MSNGTVEVLGARDRRRRWSPEQKLRIVAESHEPGANVRAVAAHHDVYPSLLHNWRRQMREGQFGALASPQFLPVRVADAAPATPNIPPCPHPPNPDTIEIELPDGCRLRVGNAVSLATLRRVVTALRG